MRLSLFLILLPPLFLIISCSSTAKKEDTLSKPEEIWLQAYARAKKQNDTESCKTFASLSQEKDFNLKTLALLRAHIACTSEQLKELAIADAPSDISPSVSYLKPLNDQRIMFEAERSQDPAQLAIAWRAKALASDRIPEKIDFLQKALDFTKSAAQKQGSKVGIEAETEIQNRIYSLAPRLKPEIAPADFQKVGADWSFNRDFEKARFYFQKILESKDTQTFGFEAKYQAFKSLRGTYKIEQNREMHISISEKMTLWLKQKKAAPALIHEAYIAWARSLWTSGQRDLAKRTLLNGKKDLIKLGPVDEFEFILGRMDEEIKDYASALEHYQRGEQLLSDSSNKKTKGFSLERMLFSKAWSLRNLGRMKEAAIVLENLRGQTQDPFDVFRYQFWQAKSLKQAGETDEARRVLENLKQEDNLGYYGLLAYFELNENLPALIKQAEFQSTTSVSLALDPETKKMIQALIATDEKEVLEKYLNQRTLELRLDGNQNPEKWLAFLKAYAQAGLFLPLFTQLGTLDNNLKLQLLKEHPELLFPKKFTEIITPWSDKLKVKPELVLSIIRQESAFNPLARSPADAFGLMQVLPRIATEQEAVTAIKLQHHEDLYMPEINIPVGVALLSQLGKKYHGQFILTAAAYNSSEKAIEGWLKTRLKEDPLEFIEDIPYDETRAYVKLVIRNFVFYSRLNQPQAEMPFPKWCLEDLQSFNLSTH